LNNRTNETVKICILLAFAGFFILPWIYGGFRLIKHGLTVKQSSDNTINLALNPKNWFNGNYQLNKEKYINESFSFRNYYIRTFNQIGYSFFDKIRNRHVVVGKEGYLFYNKYIEAFCGEDYIGEDSIRSKVQRLSFLTKALKNINKDLIIILAPNKADVFKEYLPFSGKNTNTLPRNYVTFLKYLNQSDVKFIDFNSWFNLYKNQTSLCLFPKYGTHWSGFGAFKTEDSISSYLNRLYSGRIPQIVFDSMVYSNRVMYRENDLAVLSNTFWGYKSYTLIPEFHFLENSVNPKPNALIIGDSFYYGLQELSFSSLFQSVEFWYYNNTIYLEDADKQLISSSEVNLVSNLKDKIGRFDVIIILCTEPNLVDLGFGFIENALSVLGNSDTKN